jgi:hypothetical protein
MIDRVKTLYHADPFRPFEVVLNNGRRVVIDDPIHVGFNEKIIVVPHGRDAMSWHPWADVQAVRPVRSGRHTRKRRRRKGE